MPSDAVAIVKEVRRGLVVLCMLHVLCVCSVASWRVLFLELNYGADRLPQDKVQLFTARQTTKTTKAGGMIFIQVKKENSQCK